MNMNKVESEVPGFTKVYESVRRLAAHHKVDQVDCQEIAIVAILEHPGDTPAAIHAARQELNKERRQRLPGRPINDRVDCEDEEEIADTRTLPRKFSAVLSLVDDDGQLIDKDEITGEDQASIEEDEHDHELPLISPGNLISAIMFLARHGKDVGQIAERTGVTKHRIRQILRDQEAIRRAIEDAAAQKELPGLECGPEDIRAPRKPIHHKPRTVQTHMGLSLFEMEEEEGELV